MRRSKPLARRTPLAGQKEPLRRSKPLGSAKARPSPCGREKARMSLATAGIVRARSKAKCHCGQPMGPFPIGYHHAFPKQLWPELADVAENIVGVCADCHANHETAHKRLPRPAVKIAAVLIADARMASYFERTYPT